MLTPDLKQPGAKENGFDQLTQTTDKDTPSPELTACTNK